MSVTWRLLLLCSLLLAWTAPARAADGTVTVNGEVLLETCTVNSGSPSFSVSLPTLGTSALTGIGSTAGATSFSLVLTDCVGLANTVTTYFENGPTTNADGRLINQTAGGASVDGQIRNADGSVVNLAASYGSQNTTPSALVGQGATQRFSIAYFANASPTTAGGFSSSVVYTLVYQ
jgi:major type 1 subunit fimbrin (pilin)